jgi:hypothetical protein
MLLCLCKYYWQFHKTNFASHFFVFYVQRRLMFSRRLLFIVTACFGLTGHHEMCRLLWWRGLLLTVMLLRFSYVVASNSRLCGLASFFIWVFFNNCYAHVCLMVLLLFLLFGVWLSWMFFGGDGSLLYGGRPSQSFVKPVKFWTFVISVLDTLCFFHC